MGFLSAPNLVPWLISRAWIVTAQFLLDHIALQLDREGIKGREDDERGGGGGNYSGEAINSRKYSNANTAKSQEQIYTQAPQGYEYKTRILRLGCVHIHREILWLDFAHSYMLY